MSNRKVKFNYAPLEKGGILFCNCRSVGRSVDHVLSAQYLLTPSLDQYQTWCRGCPQWVYDPYWFSDHMFKGQETWLNIIKNSLLFPFYLWKGRGISFKFGWNQPTEPGEDFKIVFHDFILFAFYSSYLFMKEGNISGTNFDILEPKNPKPSCVVDSSFCNVFSHLFYLNKYDSRYIAFCQVWLKLVTWLLRRCSWQKFITAMTKTIRTMATSVIERKMIASQNWRVYIVFVKRNVTKLC